MEPTKVAICIPVHKGFHHWMWRSLDGLERPRPNDESFPGETHVLDCLGLPLYQARAELTEQALARGVEWLLWVDTDMTFPPDGLKRLLAHNLPIVGGLCHDRRPPMYTPLLMRRMPDATRAVAYGFVYEYPDDGLFVVDAIGPGFLLTHREVFEAIEAREPGSRWWDPRPRLTEDISFSERALEAGYRIAVDLSLNIGHIGEVVVDRSFAQRNRTSTAHEWRPTPAVVGLPTTGYVPPDAKAEPASRIESSGKPRVLLLADVHDWAFDQNLHDLAEYLSDEFDFSFWYVADGAPFPHESSFDLVYVPYQRWQVVADGTVPMHKAVGSLRSRWFDTSAPGLPSDADVDMVNRFLRYHVVTRDNLAELTPRCPRVEYLTNPVNMRRFPSPTPVVDRIVASWSGNARHFTRSGVDCKGFESVVIPAVRQAKVDFVFAEYNTRRLAPPEMIGFYQRGNVTLCASLFEGASNSVMEAMAAGHAIIATAVGNHLEMVESAKANLGTSGIILVPRDVSAVVHALGMLKSNPAEVATMGAINRQEIDERWSWTAWAPRYAAFLKAALDERQARGD